MPLDLPDFTRKMSIDLDVNLTWTEYLAYAIRGIRRLDDKGTVLYYENFEDGLVRWGIASVPGTGKGRACGEAAPSGGYCMELATPTPVAGVTYAINTTYIKDVSKLGIQCSVAWPDSDISIVIYLINCREDYDAGYIFVIHNDGTISVVDEDEVEHEVGNISIYGFWSAEFHDIKLVFDLDNRVYLSLQIDDIVYDISGIAARKTDPSENRGNWLYIMAISTEHPGAVFYIDDIIVTEET